MSYINPDDNINPDTSLVHYLNSLSKEQRQLEILEAHKIIKKAQNDYKKIMKEKKSKNIFSYFWGDY